MIFPNYLEWFVVSFLFGWLVDKYRHRWWASCKARARFVNDSNPFADSPNVKGYLMHGRLRVDGSITVDTVGWWWLGWNAEIKQLYPLMKCLDTGDWVAMKDTTFTPSNWHHTRSALALGGFIKLRPITSAPL